MDLIEIKLTGPQKSKHICFMNGDQLQKKLFIRENQKIGILNSPEGFLAFLGQLPVGSILSTGTNDKFDFILLFVRNQQELDELSKKTISCLKEGGIFWISYPKLTSKLKTDLNRDKGWRSIKKAGFISVSMVSIDEVWSAVRFKPVHLIPILTRGTKVTVKGIDNKKRTVTPPADLKKVLSKNKKAMETFNNFAFSHKKEYVRWIEEAKKPETREKRIKETVAKIISGKRFMDK